MRSLGDSRRDCARISSRRAGRSNIETPASRLRSPVARNARSVYGVWHGLRPAATPVPISTTNKRIVPSCRLSMRLS
jgi:hypothetical protein